MSAKNYDPDMVFWFSCFYIPLTKDDGTPLNENLWYFRQTSPSLAKQIANYFPDFEEQKRKHRMEIYREFYEQNEANYLSPFAN